MQITPIILLSLQPSFLLTGYGEIMIIFCWLIPT